jgi:hypothetical protein
MRGIGQPWRQRVCLVGGLVPMYLVPMTGYRQPMHVGSTDVDVALRLAVEDADEGAYSTLAKNLKRIGFSRVNGSSWRWFVAVDGEPIVLEFLGDSAEVSPGTPFRASVTPPAGAGGVGLLCVRGVELAFADAVTVTRDVKLPGGALSTVEFRVTNIAPYVALKADAYLDRGKAKDAYDLIYVLRWWPEGPAAAAQAVSRSPVAAHPFVRGAVERVASRFTDPGRDGPIDYAALAAGGAAGQSRATAANEAVAVMRAFTTALSRPE